MLAESLYGRFVRNSLSDTTTVKNIAFQMQRYPSFPHELN